MLSKSIATSVALVAIICLFFPASAYAYLDPGTGSYIFQLILAGLVGFLFVLRLYWKRIKGFFTRSSSGTVEPEIGKPDLDEGEDA